MENYCVQVRNRRIRQLKKLVFLYITTVTLLSGAITITYQLSSNFVQAVMLLSCIRGVRGSNLGLDIITLAQVFRGSPQSLHEYAGTVSQNMPL
jgi:hypothetical protein